MVIFIPKNFKIKIKYQTTLSNRKIEGNLKFYKY